MVGHAAFQCFSFLAFQFCSTARVFHRRILQLFGAEVAFLEQFQTFVEPVRPPVKAQLQVAPGAIEFGAQRLRARPFIHDGGHALAGHAIRQLGFNPYFADKRAGARETLLDLAQHERIGINRGDQV